MNWDSHPSIGTLPISSSLARFESREENLVRLTPIGRCGSVDFGFLQTIVLGPTPHLEDFFLVSKKAAVETFNILLTGSKTMRIASLSWNHGPSPSYRQETSSSSCGVTRPQTFTEEGERAGQESYRTGSWLGT